MASSSGSSKRTTKDQKEEFNDPDLKGDVGSLKTEPASGKRMKKDDNSSVNVLDDAVSENTSNCADSDNNIDDTSEVTQSSNVEDKRDCPNFINLKTTNRAEDEFVNDPTKSELLDYPSTSRRIRNPPGVINSSDEYDDSDAEIEEIKPKNEGTKNFDPTPNTPRPKHQWSGPKSVMAREYGYSSKYSPDLFRYNCYGSLHMVERLELMYKMNKHDGCVNTLNFNSTGTRLVSSSDDLQVVVWNWIVSEPVLCYPSEHHANVFQAKFMPLSNDTYIVTCGRDGQIRLGELSPTGLHGGTKKLAQHKGSAHKIAMQNDSPKCFLSCGEDASIFQVDIREKKPNKLVRCISSGRKVPLYSIFINPQKSFEFAVAGRCEYVKVYDSRSVRPGDSSLKDYCPEHLVDDKKVNVTCVVYNHNGSELLATYNDEDIYLFNTDGETGKTNYEHRYRGHRNNQTVKGVNFFGPKSEYVMSGSDCSCIFFWEKESEHVVKYMYGDEAGAVNCLEPNPTMPVLASSGLDDDIKIWVPSCEDPPDLSRLRKHMIQNMRDRHENVGDPQDAFVDQAIWFLMEHISRPSRIYGGQRSNRPVSGGPNNDASDASSTSSDDELASSRQCAQS